MNLALAAFAFIGKIIILTYPDKVVNHILIEANQAFRSYYNLASR
jgi:hypothetical protein